MSYSRRIESLYPGCMLFLIDQSGSMDEELSGTEGKRKADAVCDVINRFLKELVDRSAKGMQMKHYFDVGVIGYGAQGAQSAFAGDLAGRDVVPITEVKDHPIRVEDRTKKVDDGAGGLVETKTKFGVWFEPMANGGTPMCQALQYAHQILADWVQGHPDCFPPIVVNITDGMATDGDPTGPAQEVMALSTNDGNVLVFNCHISSVDAETIQFPDTDRGLPDEFAQMLFKMSSVVPESLCLEAEKSGLPAKEQMRGFAFNADLVTLVNFLTIGTLAAKKVDLDR